MLFSGYSFFFLLPFFLPASSAWSLLPLPLGAVVVPLARRALFPSWSWSMFVAAALAGVLYSGLYLTAVDSAMNPKGAGFADMSFYRTFFSFAFSPYGLIGGGCLLLVARLIHEGVDFMMRTKSPQSPS
jgi:hypothetical protein